MNSFILASSSSQRLSLLHSVGYQPSQVAPLSIDKTIHAKELPRNYCKRIAFTKALTVSRQFTQNFVLGVCTTTSRGRMILTKPHNVNSAYKLFNLLSGRRHSVFTGICVMKDSKTIVLKIVQTKLKFKLLSSKEIKYLIHFNEWNNKHGCYSLNTMSGAFIQWINGHPTHIMGLPIHETYKILTGLGIKQEPMVCKESIK